MKRIALILLLACSCSKPTAPPRPRYELGPGCTVTARHRLSDSTWDLTVHRFDDCLSVVWDSTLVK